MTQLELHEPPDLEPLAPGVNMTESWLLFERRRRRGPRRRRVALIVCGAATAAAVVGVVLLAAVPSGLVLTPSSTSTDPADLVGQWSIDLVDVAGQEPVNPAPHQHATITFALDGVTWWACNSVSGEAVIGKGTIHAPGPRVMTTVGCPDEDEAVLRAVGRVFAHPEITWAITGGQLHITGGDDVLLASQPRRPGATTIDLADISVVVDPMQLSVGTTLLPAGSPPASVGTFLDAVATEVDQTLGPSNPSARGPELFFGRLERGSSNSVGDGALVLAVRIKGVQAIPLGPASGPHEPVPVIDVVFYDAASGERILQEQSSCDGSLC
jgi:heat shock protein HslJ